MPGAVANPDITDERLRVFSATVRRNVREPGARWRVVIRQFTTTGLRVRGAARGVVVPIIIFRLSLISMAMAYQILMPVPANAEHTMERWVAENYRHL